MITKISKFPDLAKRPEIKRNSIDAGPAGVVSSQSFEAITERNTVLREASLRQRAEMEAAKREAAKREDMNEPAPAIEPKRDLDLDRRFVDMKLQNLEQQVQTINEALNQKNDELDKMRDELDYVMGENKRTEDMLDRVEGYGYIIPRRVSRDCLSIEWACPLPFDWYWSGAKQVTIGAGSARAHYSNLSDGLLASEDEDEAVTVIDLPDSTIPRTEYVYAHVGFNFSASAGSRLTLEILHGTSVPDDAPYIAGALDAGEIYIKLYTFTTAGATPGSDARYVLSKVHHMGDIDIWPNYALWKYNATPGLEPTIGTHLDGTQTWPGTNSITFVGGIATGAT